MEFNTIVKNKIFLPILQKYGFELIEEFKNILRFQSPYIKINIVYNSFENSSIFWLGKRDSIDAIEIDNDVLSLFFNSNLKLSEVSVEKFINNLVIFFENEGESILAGNEKKINDLEKFYLVKNRKYNQNLLNQQHLNDADKAWNQNDFKGFISIIDKLNYENIPKFYLLKYRIAKRKQCI